MVIMEKIKKQILLSNDDGIDSPGLWAAAEALSELGYVTVAAPRDHMSATGRGHQRGSDGSITKKVLNIRGQNWDVYAIGGSPSQTVVHGLIELVPQKPDLVVSGINFGENLGTDVTYSGTIGAAIEGASFGIPALAVSRQLTSEEWDGFAPEVDFSVSAYFTKVFAKILLEKKMPADVDVLNVVVPEEATFDTPWKVTKQAKIRYFKPFVQRDGQTARISSNTIKDEEIPPGNDMYTMRLEHKVAVVPISLDLTSRVNLNDFEELLRK